MSLPETTSVLIVGGGPCGLMLSIELGRRGVSATLVDDKPGTAFNPQANATQARTMEHYRRLGFADDIRALGLPADYPTDIAYFTRYATHEIARFELPSSKDAKELIKQLNGSWSAAELPHRVSQKFVEQVLLREARKLAGISINFGWRLSSFAQDDRGVTAEVENAATDAQHTIRSLYLVGCDGARSVVRRQLGFQFTGETGIVRDFMGGRMYAIYLRAPDFYRIVPHPKAWMYVTVNRDRRAYMAAVDGKSEFAFHTQLRGGEEENVITERDALAMFRQGVGAPIEAEILSRCGWNAGHALVAERMQSGRVFIGGDAAHLFTPAGGLGYNTAIEDAVNLGWKLAARIKGTGGAQLVATYETERQPVARRNTSYARQLADSLGLYEPPPTIEEDSREGELARAQAGAHFNIHGRTEFNIPGITFGGRYDGSPIIVTDGTAPPPDASNVYLPTACPGGRAPHLWLEDGRSLFDSFGFEWTLLRLGARAPDVTAFRRAAADASVELTVVDVRSDEARDLYAADVALIRPDQIVAWRGDGKHAEPSAIFAQITGHTLVPGTARRMD
jgi:2-polyprenyl-6-methoxyphenol hydroxylase-like FAD-dependent oxidoreductase